MKQTIKKKLSFLLATLLVVMTAVSVIMPTTVFAAESYTLTLENTGKTEHTFEIYQIFKGDLSEGILSNIQWGSGIKDQSKGTLGDANESAKKLTSPAEAEKFAEEIQKDLSDTKQTKTIAAGDRQDVTGLEPGYYLVKDTANSQNQAENGAYTSYILKVVKNTEAKTKLDVPTVEKKVQENSNKNWQDAADYNIGDTVPYKLTGTLPTNYDKYETYKYSFHDEMSTGLTFNQDSVKVKVDDVTLNETDYQLTPSANGFTLTFTDLKAIKTTTITKDSKITVEYTATLNEHANTGKVGNDNTVYLEYSNNPNKDGNGEYGQTPKDKSIVFTYLVNVNKKNENDEALQGAEFELYKKTDNGEEKITRFTIDSIMDQNKSTFRFKGLDAGKYVLKESKTPNGYNTIKPVEFEIKAEYDTTSDNPELKKLEGVDTLNLGILNFTADVNAGSLSTDVINSKGFTLPETGGMGRTIIYVLGIAFVVVALGYFGVKRRKKQSSR